MKKKIFLLMAIIAIAVIILIATPKNVFAAQTIAYKDLNIGDTLYYEDSLTITGEEGKTIVFHKGPISFSHVDEITLDSNGGASDFSNTKWEIMDITEDANKIEIYISDYIDYNKESKNFVPGIVIKATDVIKPEKNTNYEFDTKKDLIVANDSSLYEWYVENGECYRIIINECIEDNSVEYWAISNIKTDESTGIKTISIVPAYKIAFDQEKLCVINPEFGEVNYAAEGKTIRVLPMREIEDGYNWEITVTDSKGTKIKADKKVLDGEQYYEFKMPADEVSIEEEYSPVPAESSSKEEKAEKDKTPKTGLEGNKISFVGIGIASLVLISGAVTIIKKK